MSEHIESAEPLFSSASVTLSSPARGGSWLLITTVETPTVSVDHDDELWIMVARLLDIQYVYSETSLLTITAQCIYFPLCYKLFIQTNVVN